MTLQKINKCPRCGGHFIWQDYTGKMDRIDAECSNSAYVTRYGLGDNMLICDFECEAVRSPTSKEVTFEWDGVIYWDMFLPAKQLKLFKESK